MHDARLRERREARSARLAALARLWVWLIQDLATLLVAVALAATTVASLEPPETGRVHLERALAWAPAPRRLPQSVCRIELPGSEPRVPWFGETPLSQAEDLVAPDLVVEIEPLARSPIASGERCPMRVRLKNRGQQALLVCGPVDRGFVSYAWSVRDAEGNEMRRRGRFLCGNGRPFPVRCSDFSVLGPGATFEPERSALLGDFDLVRDWRTLAPGVIASRSPTPSSATSRPSSKSAARRATVPTRRSTRPGRPSSFGGPRS